MSFNESTTFDLVAARKLTQQNLEKLRSNTQKFGRVEMFSNKKLDQPLRPFPHYFAWKKETGEEESNAKTFVPGQSSKQKSLEKATVQKSPSKKPAVNQAVPAVVPKHINEAESLKLDRGTADVQPSTASIKIAAPLVAAIAETKLNPANLERKLESGGTTLQDSEIAVLPKAKQNSHSLSKKASRNENIKKGAVLKDITTAPAPKTEKVSSLVIVGKQVDIAEVPAHKAQENEANAAKNEAPSSAFLKTDPHIRKFQERATATVGGNGGGSGGGGIKSGSFDELTMLCKQHRLQYAKCHYDLEELSKRSPAGILMPGDGFIPMFFAWSKSNHKSSVQIMEAPILAADKETKIEGTTINHPLTEVERWKEARASDEKEGCAVAEKSESLKHVFVQSKGCMSHSKQNQDKPFAGVATYWEPKSPFFYAWGNKSATMEASNLTSEKKKEVAAPALTNVNKDDCAGRKTKWECKSPNFYAWSRKEEDEATAQSNKTTEVSKSNEKKSETIDCAGVMTPSNIKSPYLYAWTLKDANQETCHNRMDNREEKERNQKTNTKNADLLQVATKNDITAGIKTHWDVKSPYFYAWPQPSDKVEPRARQDETHLSPSGSPPIKDRTEKKAVIMATLKKDEVEHFLTQSTTGLHAHQEVALQAVLEKNLSPQRISKTATRKPLEHIVSSPSKRINKKKKSAPWTKRDEIRRERMLGQKHRRLQAEISSGYIRRSEYMEKYGWPVMCLKEANKRCVSIYSKRKMEPAGGLPLHVPTQLVGNGEDALAVTKRLSHQFLKKSVAFGGVKDLEGSYEEPLQESCVQSFQKGESSIVAIPATNMQVERKEGKDASIASEEEFIEPTGAVMNERPNCFEKIKKADILDMDRIWKKRAARPKKARAPIPSHFAWSRERDLAELSREDLGRSITQAKKGRKKTALRRNPKNGTLGNPILMARRYPMSETYKPKSEYMITYNTIRRKTLQ